MNPRNWIVALSAMLALAGCGAGDVSSTGAWRGGGADPSADQEADIDPANAPEVTSGSCGAMSSGFVLPRGSAIASCNGKAKLVHQTDGNVVMYNIPQWEALWSTGTWGKSTANFIMQTDGNLVLYNASWQPLWSSGTWGKNGATAAIQGDCNFVVYQAGKPIWNSRTQCVSGSSGTGGSGGGSGGSGGGTTPPPSNSKTKRFVAGGGIIGNIAWLAQNGFAEFHYVVGDTGSHAAERQKISAAGLRAVLNPFNDGNGVGPGGDGSSWSWYFPSIKNAGWAAAAGEGEGGSLIGVCMQSLPYINYGGIVSEQQYDMYASPWNHPSSGTYGHADYIETYDNYGHLVLDSTLAAMKSAKAHGSQDIGILIGAWAMNSASTWISFIDRAEAAGVHVRTVMFWTGYSYDIVQTLQGSSVWKDLQNHYGIDKSSP
jgi:hypothetical protein